MIALWWMLGACEKKVETSFEQYNAEDNTVDIEVGAASELPSVETVLTSNTGTIEIGVGSVDPGGGPVGTEHTVRVQVYPDYKDDIDRVTVRTDSGEGRGEDEYDLDKDSTGEGYWVLDLVSCCEGDTERTDTLTFRLYEEVAVEDDGE